MRDTVLKLAFEEAAASSNAAHLPSYAADDAAAAIDRANDDAVAAIADNDAEVGDNQVRTQDRHESRGCFSGCIGLCALICENVFGVAPANAGAAEPRNRRRSFGMDDVWDYYRRHPENLINDHDDSESVDHAWAENVWNYYLRHPEELAPNDFDSAEERAEAEAVEVALRNGWHGWPLEPR